MSKYSKLGRVAKCGSPDSKYMSNPNGLDEDVNAKQIEYEKFRMQVRRLVTKEPGKVDVRYKELITVALELKQEFNL